MKKITKLITSIFVGCHVYCLQAEKNNPNYIQTYQYRANNPIQDRVCFGNLDKVKGFVASVFDGHGGYLTADFAAGNIVQFLNSRINQNLKLNMSEKALVQKSLNQAYDDLQNSFLTIFKESIGKQQLFKMYRRVGACALTAVVLKNSLHVANAGDCQGVILGSSDPIKINQRLNAGEPAQQQRLKRQFPDEHDIYRCIKNTNYCYVKGRLQPTRSLGDFYLKYKQYNFTKLAVFTGPYITHKPKITSFELNQKHSKLVLASDGLWDELDDKQMNSVALEQKDEGLAQSLFDAALVKINERNNTTFEKLDKVENRRDMHDDISIITIDLEELRKSL